MPSSECPSTQCSFWPLFPAHYDSAQVWPMPGPQFRVDPGDQEVWELAKGQIRYVGVPSLLTQMVPCCALNVYVPSQIHVFNPNPQCGGIWRWSLWEVLIRA